MKKLNLIVVLTMLLVSCQKDDDTLVPQCNEPVNLSTSNVASTSATLLWEYNTPNTTSTFEVEYGISGFATGTGTVRSTSEGTITLDNLEPNTTYDFYVQTLCGTDNTSMVAGPESFTTSAPPVVPEFRPTLSELQLFQGPLGDLQPSPYTFEYHLSTTLYTDYALKQRIVALPAGTSMDYIDDGLPGFPDQTVIAKTFYYNIDDRDPSLGKTIVETRVMIKLNGVWEFGNYIWNDDQTDAVFDTEGAVSPVSWIDNDGNTRNADYEIPSAQDCFTCHQSFGDAVPIGPKLRSMNFELAGVNQLQSFIANGQLSNAPDIGSIGSLPNWEDTSLPDERRVRAYFDMNCAHCHTAGGYHTVNYFDALDVAYETPFDESHIFDERYSILTRIQSAIEEYSMPYIGVTAPHQEALDLIVPYLESLE